MEICFGIVNIVFAVLLIAFGFFFGIHPAMSDQGHGRNDFAGQAAYSVIFYIAAFIGAIGYGTIFKEVPLWVGMTLPCLAGLLLAYKIGKKFFNSPKSTPQNTSMPNEANDSTDK